MKGKAGEHGHNVAGVKPVAQGNKRMIVQSLITTTLDSINAIRLSGALASNRSMR